VTVVETVYQLAQKCGLKILLVAPSNDAADILVERLMSYFNPSEMRRILAYSRTLETVPKSIHRFVTVGGPSAEEIVSPSVRIVVSTVNLAARFSYLGVTKGLFDVLCVDEAGCATEPEVIAVAASLMDFDQDAQIVLAGDPKQLGPIIASELCNEFGMSASYMARLMNHKLYSRNDGEYRPDYVTKLVRNYRSHSSIIKLPNSMFYDNELICNGDQLATHSLSKWEHLPKKGFPIIFHAVEGENLRESNSPSWFNPQEAEQVVDYVKMLIHETRPPLLPTDIGVITPYARQAQKIRLAVESSGIKDVKVGSVETFQGQERRCIIVSTVRSVREQVSVDIKYNLGFVANEKRFNVAITRAISLLIVVGCPHVLAMDEANWLPFLRYCHENGAWCGEDWDPSTQIEEIKSDSSSDDESWECVDRPSQRAEQEGFVFTSREE
jgi:superfamily I DNA and/or RNA helicase